MLYCLSDGVHFLTAAGAEHHILFLTGIVAPALQYGGAPAGAFIYDPGYLSAIVRDDQGHLTVIHAIEYLIHDSGHEISGYDTVDEAVDLPEYQQASDKYDAGIQHQGYGAEGDMGIGPPDGHAYEVLTSGGGAAHEDHGIACPAENSHADRGQQPVTAVGGKQGSYVIYEYRGYDHALY